MVMPKADGGLGLVDFRRQLKVLRGWWGCQMEELGGEGWSKLTMNNWEVRFCSWSEIQKDMQGLLQVGKVGRLCYRGFWWSIVEAWLAMGLMGPEPSGEEEDPEQR